MRNTITCCFGCTDRKAECHAVCERYLKEKTKQEEMNKIIRENKLKEPPAINLASFIGNGIGYGKRARTKKGIIR